MINYVRIVHKVKCNSCNYIDYDLEFKNEYNVNKKEEGIQETTYTVVCPKCNSDDTIYVESRNTTKSVNTITYDSNTTTYNKH